MKIKKRKQMKQLQNEWRKGKKRKKENNRKNNVKRERMKGRKKEKRENKEITTDFWSPPPEPHLSLNTLIKTRMIKPNALRALLPQGAISLAEPS